MVRCRYLGEDEGRTEPVHAASVSPVRSKAVQWSSAAVCATCCQEVRRTAPDRIISTVDPEARHIHKSGQQRDGGYKAHLAVEPETGLFTAIALRLGAGADHHEAVVARDLLAHLDQVLRAAKRAGYPYLGLDGTLIPIGRVAADRPYYSGKH